MAFVFFDEPLRISTFPPVVIFLLVIFDLLCCCFVLLGQRPKHDSTNPLLISENTLIVGDLSIARLASIDINLIRSSDRGYDVGHRIHRIWLPVRSCKSHGLSTVNSDPWKHCATAQGKSVRTRKSRLIKWIGERNSSLLLMRPV